MDFTSDTETIIKLQSLNNTISNLEKTYQGLLTDAKNIAERQEKNITKIEKIEQLDQLINDIGGYEQLESLLIEIKEITPLLKQSQNQIQEYGKIDKNLAEKIKITEDSLTIINEKIEQMGGLRPLAQLISQVNETKEYLEVFAEELTQNISDKIKNELTDFSHNLIQEIKKKIETKTIIEFEEEKQENFEDNQEDTLNTTSANSTKLTWENIIQKEPLVGIIKKYAETYRIEKLYTANTGQLVYGIKRTTIRVIIIMQNMKGKSIILRDEDKRKELNLTAQEANFIYEYIDSYLQPIA
jgi:hypothetical protein